MKYQDVYAGNKDNMLLAVALWTYYNDNEDSFELLWNIDLKKVSISTLLTIIRDYPNMREDVSIFKNFRFSILQNYFKEKLFEIGQESEKVVTEFIKRF